jgi:hypothetical protein
MLVRSLALPRHVADMSSGEGLRRLSRGSSEVIARGEAAPGITGRKCVWLRTEVPGRLLRPFVSTGRRFKFGFFEYGVSILGLGLG